MGWWWDVIVYYDPTRMIRFIGLGPSAKGAVQTDLYVTQTLTHKNTENFTNQYGGHIRHIRHVRHSYSIS